MLEPPELTRVAMFSITMTLDSMYSLIETCVGSHDIPMTTHVTPLAAEGFDDGWYATWHVHRQTISTYM